MTTLRTTARRGALLTEVVISVVLLGTLIVTATSLQSSSARANRNVLLRLRCIAAAQAALDSLAATGEPLAEADVRRLWPNMQVQVRTEAGKGDWAGLTLAAAVARAADDGRGVSVELRRYVDSAIPAAPAAPAAPATPATPAATATTGTAPAAPARPTGPVGAGRDAP